MTTAEDQAIKDVYEQDKMSARSGRLARTAPAAAAAAAGGHQSVSSPASNESSLPSPGPAGDENDTVEEIIRHTQADARTAPDAPPSAPLLDAYWASYGDAPTRAALRAGALSVKTAENVIGSDDRSEITTTNVYPWCAIASLIITAQTGATYIGTAWFIGPRILATAGHNVFMQDQGGWASQIQVIPGRHGSDYPFGSVMASAWRSTIGWSRDGNSDYDYGALLLPEASRLGDTVGWFGYEARDNSNLQGQIVNIAGYPGDKPDGTLWHHSNTVTNVHDFSFDYEIDTYGGQSGAPVYMYFEDRGRIGVGVHTYGSVSGNSATRITAPVLTNFAVWKAEVP